MIRRNRYTRSYNLSSIELLQNNHDLIIPDVQRDLVWTLSQKQLLIDSLLRDYDVPKIYFREIEKNGKTYFEVIDGQQRLNTIFDFFKDKFAMPNDSDKIGNENIANKKFSGFSSSLQIELKNRTLDVVHLQGYTDEERDETFLRLQNGTPLKAAEKRRAIIGNMRNVIRELAKDDVFSDLCSFDDIHYAYEDMATKILKLIQDGAVTPITAQALKKMYETQTTISENDRAVKDTKKALNFLKKSFKNTDNPHLKKYAVLDLCVIANSLLNTYDISQYANEFGKAFLEFSNDRILNNEKEENDRDPRFDSYSNAARGDNIEFMEFRQRFLKEYILEKMPFLEVKDQNRFFTPDQRAVIYRLGGGVCAICGEKVSEDDFEADHIKPYSKGGRTQIANGQVLCMNCNRKKSDNT